MILDKLENADWYFASVPGFERFMQFFNDNDLEEMPACKIKLDGNDLMVTISDVVGKDLNDGVLEAHRDYVDIHIPLTADETIGWRSQVDCENIIKEYDEGKDVELYGDKASSHFVIPQGHFAIFFPTDAHQPGIAQGQYRKVVVKTKVQ